MVSRDRDQSLDIETATGLFFALAPLAFSPGPANVLFAASGSTFGVRASLPFWFGTNLVCVFQTLAVGFGLAALITESEQIRMLLRYVGVAVLLYFALRFFRSRVNQRQVLKPLSFREGLLVELLNAKFMLIPVVMFSLFLKSNQGGAWGVLTLTIVLMLITMSANLAWIIGGKAAMTLVKKDWFERNQGIFFGSILMITAFWLAIA